MFGHKKQTPDPPTVLIPIQSDDPCTQYYHAPVDRVLAALVDQVGLEAKYTGYWQTSTEVRNIYDIVTPKPKDTNSEAP